MKRSLDIAAECGKKTIAVTYDLAIAKVAMQIQAEETPVFDNIFVALGSFHIEMALLSAYGKFIAESGGPHILNECEVLAKGSINSFNKGKNYKRCKRMHELLALAMESLHFEMFLASQENSFENYEIIRSEVGVMKQEIDHEDSNFVYSKEMEDIFTKYTSYCDDTRKGEHGKTAKYWIEYISMIHLYHDFSRSIRVGDLELYIDTLPKIANFFFALNHPNYARWAVRYHENLFNPPETHPEVYEDFKKGWFGVKRTSKSFSRGPIDLTLEQTINADAASQKMGISFITDSISARQRWAESHFLRTAVISSVFEELGMTKKEDISKDLKNYRIKSDNAALKKIKAMVHDTVNPFNTELDYGNLYNLGTGKAASKSAEDFLLNLKEIGEIERKKFIVECAADPGRFESRIKRQKLNTFATDGGKNKLKGANGKIIAACLVRDLFGSILYLSLERKIDMGEVLKYPLTPVPLSLCHVDGTMQKSPKSALMKNLESRIVSEPPVSVDVTIIDAMFFLHLYQNLPATFGGVASFLLSKILNIGGNTIHFVSDKWITPSIKDCERQNRETVSVSYQIKGAAQKRPTNWIAALKNSSFKESLVEFLLESWQDDTLSHLFQNKILYANYNDTCFKYEAEDNKVYRHEATYLYSTHEEADSRMFFHLANVSAPSNVVIRTADTDCLIIGLACKKFYDASMRVWLEVGVQSRNNQRYINLNQLHHFLGESLCNSLPAYHALTGCDYTASFCRKGKVTPLKILEKDIAAQEALGQLGIVTEITNSIVKALEKFICSIYGKKTFEEVNKVRIQIFLDKFKPKKKEDRISCVKKLDGSAMPPCSRVILNKLKRTHLIASQWISSTKPHPPMMIPVDYGWKIVNGKYEIQWFEGETCPKALDVICSEEDDEELIGE